MKQKHKISLAGIVTVLILIFALPLLRTSRIEIPSPAQQSDEPLLPQAVNSHVQIEFQASLAALESALNSKVPKAFGGTINDPTDALTDDSIKWNLALSEIDSFPDQGGLGLQASFKGGATLHGRFGVKKRNKGPLGWLEEVAGGTFSETPHIAGTVRGVLRPKFNSDWTIDPGVSLQVNLSKAEAQIFGKAIKVSFRGAIEREIQSAAGKLSQELNAQLVASNQLRNEVQKGWTSLHFVTPVYSTPAVWVSLQPVALGAADPVVTEEKLTMTVAAVVSTAVRVGGDAPTFEMAELPALTPVVDPGGNFSMAVPVAISLSDFHNVSPNELEIPDTIETSVGSVKVKKLFLLGDAGTLYIGADIVANVGWLKRVKGTLYFAGTPVLDKESNLLRIDDLAYDLQTTNVLAGTADFLLEPVILNRLRELAVFDVGAARRELLGLADAEVAKLTAALPSGVELDFKVSDIDLSQIVVDKGWLIAVVHAGGPAVVRVEGLDAVMANVSIPQ